MSNRSAVDSFDPEAKEQALLAEANSWDTSHPADPEPGDIPVVDVGPYFATGAASELAAAAALLNHACERVGFFQLVGHHMPSALIADTFAEVKRFHDLDLDSKQQINIDNPDWPVKGVGYMPVGERRLPRRATGNLNVLLQRHGRLSDGLPAVVSQRRQPTEVPDDQLPRKPSGGAG